MRTSYSSSDSCTWEHRQLTRSAIDLRLFLAPDLDGTRAGTTARTSDGDMVKVSRCTVHGMNNDMTQIGKHSGVLFLSALVTAQAMTAFMAWLTSTAVA